MIFESLKENLNKVFKKLRSKGRLTEEDIKSALREIRVALLEADVNFKVVKELIARLEEKARSEKVIESLTPSEQIITLLYKELVNVLSEGSSFSLKKGEINYLFLVGLQGNGKTTTAAKLSYAFKKEGFKPVLVPLDFKRPRAREQLISIASSNGLAFLDRSFDSEIGLLKGLPDYLENNNYDVAIIDTAGRQEIDREVMEELKQYVSLFPEREVLLVMDATIGQSALSVAVNFEDYVHLTGGIFTKFDSSAKGGSVLSFKHVTGAPVRFLGTGEKIEDLETFDADRLISRLLGRGDIKTLIEKAEKAISYEESLEIMNRLSSGSFTLKDFKKELEGIRKMGGLSSVISLLPQAAGLSLPKDFSDERMIKKMVAIIDSMTEEERSNPNIMNASRKERIAKGAGVDKHDINMLLKNFENFRKFSKNLKSIDQIMKLR